MYKLFKQFILSKKKIIEVHIPEIISIQSPTNDDLNILPIANKISKSNSDNKWNISLDDYLIYLVNQSLRRRDHIHWGVIASVLNSSAYSNSILLSNECKNRYNLLNQNILYFY